MRKLILTRFINLHKKAAKSGMNSGNLEMPSSAMLPYLICKLEIKGAINEIERLNKIVYMMLQLQY